MDQIKPIGPVDPRSARAWLRGSERIVAMAAEAVDGSTTITAGYHDGTGTVSGDAELTPDNIKKDVTIFGVTGTHEGSGGE